MTIETWWWLLFWTASGLCVGSFLNVVIYRIPLGLSIRHPRRSFCPSCQTPLQWYDNLPLVSYLRLSGRCRCCGNPISSRYPVIEVATAVVVLLLLDVFFVGQVREGIYRGAIGLSWRLAEDWPIFLAHVILFACLLGMSAIDIENYWIDTAFATRAVIAGFILHGLWTPRHSLASSGGGEGWIRPWDGTAVACVAAFVGLLAVGIVRRLWGSGGEPDPEPGLPADDAPGAPASAASGESDRVAAETGSFEAEIQNAESAAAPSVPGRRCGRDLLWAWALTGALVVLIVVLAGAARASEHAAPGLRYALPLVGFLVLIIAVGSVARPADAQVVQAIELERPQARKMVLAEFACLLPAILLAVVALLAYARSDPQEGWMVSVLHWAPTRSGGWQPVFGLATAATGYVIAAGAGWLIRIVATLIYGKEAFGDGDIYVMAAAGCVAGWPIVVLGFLMTCVFAVAGVVIMLPFKRARAIPLVPWLSLSFLATVVFYERLLEFQPVRTVIELAEITMSAGNS
ncbi:MAG: A24 family peptidase [Phycisphaerales bacterium]|nr:MAG: A24 family peptidase [Phycisphaerales bacterium]